MNERYLKRLENDFKRFPPEEGWYMQGRSMYKHLTDEEKTKMYSKTRFKEFSKEEILLFEEAFHCLRVCSGNSNVLRYFEELGNAFNLIEHNEHLLKQSKKTEETLKREREEEIEKNKQSFINYYKRIEGIINY
jgi:hypothetical protein